MTSDERRFYLGFDAEEFASGFDMQAKSAWDYVVSLNKFHRDTKSTRFYAHEVLWARLAVDLASLAALIRQDALTEAEDVEMAAIVCGEAKGE